MREVTVRIRFTRPSLGNVKSKAHRDGCFLFARNADNRIIFLACWHQANMRFATNLLGRHHDAAQEIHWDIAVEGEPVRGHRWFRRYYTTQQQHRRFVQHEAFSEGQIVGINCVVPSSISDSDLFELMKIAGQYRGLSPYAPKEWGHFEVESIRPRRSRPDSPKQINTAVHVSESSMQLAPPKSDG